MAEEASCRSRDEVEPQAIEATPRTSDCGRCMAEEASCRSRDEAQPQAIESTPRTSDCGRCIAEEASCRGRDEAPPEVIDLEEHDHFDWQLTNRGWKYTPKNAEKDSTLHSCQIFARTWRGDCLCTAGVADQMGWKCARGHTWVASADDVKLRSIWCPRWICQRGQHPAEAQSSTMIPPMAVLRRMAAASGCVCTDPNSSTAEEETRLKWKCAEGCIFEQTHARGAQIAGWCPTCDDMRTQILRQINAFVYNKGGQCLEVPAGVHRWYRDRSSRLKLCCGRRHSFTISMSELDQGQWCPHGECGREAAERARVAAHAREQMAAQQAARKAEEARLAEEARAAAHKGREDDRSQDGPSQPAQQPPPAGSRGSSSRSANARNPHVPYGMSEEEAREDQRRRLEESKRRRYNPGSTSTPFGSRTGYASFGSARGELPRPQAKAWGHAHPGQQLPSSIGVPTRSAYDVLEIPYSASRDCIRKAYKRLALRYHPDKQTGDEGARTNAQQKFIEVQKAHDLLTWRHSA